MAALSLMVAGCSKEEMEEGVTEGVSALAVSRWSGQGEAIPANTLDIVQQAQKIKTLCEYPSCCSEANALTSEENPLTFP